MPLSSNGAARKSSMPTTLAAAPAMPDNGVGAFDPLSELLRRVKLSAWVAGMSELRSPWGLRVPTQAGGFYAICEGSACLQVDDGPVHMMAAGDVALVTRGVENIIRDAPGSPTRSVLKLVSPEMARRHEGLRLDGPGPRTRMICGAFRFDGEASRPLPSALPPVLVARGANGRAMGTLGPVLELLNRQVADSSHGTHAVMNALASLLFVEVVRDYLRSEQAPEGTWLGALLDEHVGPVLGLIHGNLSRDWSLPDLANEAGLSRSVFYERFVGLVGSPPHRYLRDLRMREAADLLTSTELELREIATRVGYSSGGAFGTAFREWSGVTPRQYREDRAGAIEPPLVLLQTPGTAPPSPGAVAV
jgi:AraC-like DNA-binding protein